MESPKAKRMGPNPNRGTTKHTISNTYCLKRSTNPLIRISQQPLSDQPRPPEAKIPNRNNHKQNRKQRAAEQKRECTWKMVSMNDEGDLQTTCRPSILSLQHMSLNSFSVPHSNSLVAHYYLYDLPFFESPRRFWLREYLTPYCDPWQP